ncbi:GNAT family N-acetyltransferase [Prochlorococcus marinus XMU1411]|uniref:GNAT family N-acetyltransferase n=1 Tax=Prochlorococcus marinus TaxID=1219 RepID=UPI001AD9574C|nr:GNAT family N-acetyltransferase [Prochlorococcus marinus]MBO8244643.1 GNAT family N-acetyltransferase [Prochlorococcus marinus XMU1411]MBW3055705.1 GNAT family N-acetyltransferase [Prochlorococcus marinus str. MU1411]MCR8537473.1 GNAT family N-acetyltransferase [Prochlorococcus marinus CUG1430]
MNEISIIKHSKGAIGLRFFGLGPKLKPSNGLNKLQKLLDRNTFWAKSRTINDLKKCLSNSDVVISLWIGEEIVGFGRALTDGVYRGVLWDVVIDQNYQGKGLGTIIIKNLLSSKEIKNTKKLYLMTTNKKLFYSQFSFKEVTSQNLLIREI